MSLNGRCHDCDGPTAEYRCKRCALMRRHGLTEREADEVLAHRAQVLADRRARLAAERARRAARSSASVGWRRKRRGNLHPLFGATNGPGATKPGLVLRRVLRDAEELVAHEGRGGWVLFVTWATALGYDDQGQRSVARRRWQRLAADLRAQGIDVEATPRDGVSRSALRLTADGRDRFEALLGAYVKWLAARAS